MAYPTTSSGAFLEMSWQCDSLLFLVVPETAPARERISKIRRCEVCSRTIRCNAAHETGKGRQTFDGCLKYTARWYPHKKSRAPTTPPSSEQTKTVTFSHHAAHESSDSTRMCIGTGGASRGTFHLLDVGVCDVWKPTHLVEKLRQSKIFAICPWSPRHIAQTTRPSRPFCPDDSLEMSLYWTHQRSLIRHGNGASSWFRRAAEPELMTQTKPQTLHRHTTCGRRGRVAFSYSKTEKNKRVWELRRSRQQSRVTIQSIWSARHPTQTQHSNARRECDDAPQLMTGSTHDMQSNFCCVMWIKKNTHTRDDLQLCWRRVPRCPIHMRVATIVPCIRHKYRNQCPAVDSWRARRAFCRFLPTRYGVIATEKMHVVINERYTVSTKQAPSQHYRTKMQHNIQSATSLRQSKRERVYENSSRIIIILPFFDRGFAEHPKYMRTCSSCKNSTERHIEKTSTKRDGAARCA